MVSPNNNNPPEEVLEIAIAEQRRVYDHLCESYQHVKIKILTFLGGGLALLTFLYSDGTTFIPPQVYGRIFYFIGLTLLVSALIMLFVAIRPTYWEVPTESVDLRKLDYDSPKDYLNYVKERYLICWDINRKAFQTKQKLLDFAFYPLIFGAIILVVLKIFKG